MAYSPPRLPPLDFSPCSDKLASGSTGLCRMGTDNTPADNVPLITINYLIVLSTALLKTTALIADKQALDTYKL